MDMEERPDGSVATILGWISLVVGVIAGFLATGADSVDGFWLSLAIANLGVGLGVLLLSLGYLVRAIWFLPGREAPLKDSKNIPAVEMATVNCEWCGIDVRAPNTPCSGNSLDRLREVKSQITSAKCLAELRERGIT